MGPDKVEFRGNYRYAFIIKKEILGKLNEGTRGKGNGSICNSVNNNKKMKKVKLKK